MSIKNLGNHRWEVRARCRIIGQVISRKKIITGTRIDARTMEVELFKELADLKKNAAPTISSLKLHTFGDVLKFWADNTEAKLDTIQTSIDRMVEDTGSVRHEEIKERFGDFLRALLTERVGEKVGAKALKRALERQRKKKLAIVRTLGAKALKRALERERKKKPATVRVLGGYIKSSTRNRYLAYAKAAYNYSVSEGKVKENPLKGFKKLYEKPRDRVWDKEEYERIFAILEKRKSYLLMPVLFASKNPIRKGDLINLKRENYHFNQFNPFRSYVHFLPQKTGKRKPKHAHLECLDKRIMEYFQSLPETCPYLFPRIDEKGRWHQLGDFKKEWKKVLSEAKVTGLTFHDIKHCAITWMMDNGYTELQLRNLGIQYTQKMIQLYYHEDPEKSMGTWEKIQEKASVVAPACGPLAQEVA